MEPRIVPMGQSELRRQLVELLPRMRRFALVLTRSSDAADDLVQVSVTRALERQEQWVEGTRLDHWLFRIIKTTWLNSRKSASLRHTEPLGDQDDAGSMDGSAAMEAHLTLNEVRIAFARLPVEQRQALLLVSVEGYSYKEAAELLDIPLGTVVSRIARGRVALTERRSRGNNNVTQLRLIRD